MPYKSCLSRGQILGRNPDKSFPPCYSQSALQPCLQIYISSNSRNLFCISSNSRNLWTISAVQLLYYTVKAKGGKPDKKTIAPSPWFEKFKQKTSSLGTFKIMAQKPQRNCTFMNSASVFGLTTCTFWTALQLHRCNINMMRHSKKTHKLCSLFRWLTLWYNTVDFTYNKQEQL